MACVGTADDQKANLRIGEQAGQLPPVRAALLELRRRRDGATCHEVLPLSGGVVVKLVKNQKQLLAGGGWKFFEPRKNVTIGGRCHRSSQPAQLFGVQLVQSAR